MFTVLLVTQGITQFKDSVGTYGDSNEEVQSILQDAKAISISLQSIGQSSIEIRDALTANLGNFCPGEPNIQTETGINFDELATQAIDQINQLGNFLEGNVGEFQGEIDAALSTSQQVGDTVDQVQANDWESLIFLIPNIILGTFMIMGVALAWFKQSIPAFTCALSWVILPLFFLASSFAFVSSAVVVYFAIANAGMCT